MATDESERKLWVSRALKYLEVVNEDTINVAGDLLRRVGRECPVLEELRAAKREALANRHSPDWKVYSEKARLMQLRAREEIAKLLGDEPPPPPSGPLMW